MKNILFVVASTKRDNSGFGGHYYSLLTYIDVLKKKFGITVFHYSELTETILDKRIPADVKYIRKSSSSNIGIKKLKPDLVVFFSLPKYIALRLKLKVLYYKIPIIGLRAGGPSPRPFFQFFNYIICFSRENLKWFNNNYHFRKYSIAVLMPNRISKVPHNTERLNAFKWFKPNSINILRISRINNAFFPAFEKTINLHKKLLENQIKANTVLIGTPENDGVVKKIKDLIDDHKGVSLLTEAEYTYIAREWIPLFDIITGVGRGFMEAASENKIVLGFSRRHSIPIIVGEHNYECFMDFNFSLRNEWGGDDDDVEFNKILNLISSEKERARIESFLFKKFLDDYDSRKIIEFFEQTTFKPRAPIKAIILDTVFVIFYKIKILIISTIKKTLLGRLRK